MEWNRNVKNLVTGIVLIVLGWVLLPIVDSYWSVFSSPAREFGKALDSLWGYGSIVVGIVVVIYALAKEIRGDPPES